MAPSSDDAMLVFTADTVQTILDKGGSGDWVINERRATRMKYLVCCRKDLWSNRKDGIDQGSAFLLGKIATLRMIKDSGNARNQDRYFIELSDYAAINVPGIWDPKERRNPVAYGTLSGFGLEFKGFKFKPMPAPSAVAADRPLSIAEAKVALAKTFGIKPEDVEITIRG